MRRIRNTAKENYVGGILSSYEYHTLCINEITEKLYDIKLKKESGGVSGVHSNGNLSQNCTTPWILNLLAEEHDLSKQLESHQRVLDLINFWVSNISNTDNHRDIFIDYVLNGCDAMVVADKYDTTDSNVRLIATRSTRYIANKFC